MNIISTNRLKIWIKENITNDDFGNDILIEWQLSQFIDEISENLELNICVKDCIHYMDNNVFNADCEECIRREGRVDMYKPNLKE